MKVLNELELYVVKANLFMWSEEKGEHTVPVYYALDLETKNKKGECMYLITFIEDLNSPNLRVFSKKKEAMNYIADRGISITTQGEHVVKIHYDFVAKEWREVNEKVKKN